MRDKFSLESSIYWFQQEQKKKWGVSSNQACPVWDKDDSDGQLAADLKTLDLTTGRDHFKLFN